VEVNDVIEGTATQTGSAYIDLRAAFKGPNYAYDETGTWRAMVITRTPRDIDKSLPP
jgi:hypothetical protein